MEVRWAGLFRYLMLSYNCNSTSDLDMSGKIVSENFIGYNALGFHWIAEYNCATNFIYSHKKEMAHSERKGLEMNELKLVSRKYREQ